MDQLSVERRARLRAQAAHPSTDPATRARIERTLARLETPDAIRPAA